jgi:hypothetical protein
MSEVKEKEMFSPQAKAVLAELAAALERLLTLGETWTIFIDKMALTRPDREAIREFLGQGSIRIKMENTAEPAEWLESGVSGVWYGVVFNQSNSPILETIEVAFFPQLAAVQTEDLKQAVANFKQSLK